MKPTKPVIIFLGPQGSGKGTQGKRLAEKLAIPYMETGKLLRDEIASGSERGVYFGSIIDKGGLLPDEDINAFMNGKLLAAYREGGFIVDGFPRRMAQAKVMDASAPPTHVVLIDISDEESVRRLSARRQCPNDGAIYNLITDPPKQDELCNQCGAALIQRADDTPEAIRYRLEQYHRDTEPVLAHYQAQGILHRIDGMPSIPEVEKAVWEIFSTSS